MSCRVSTAAIAAVAVFAALAPAPAAATVDSGRLPADLAAVVAGGPTGALLEVRDGRRVVRLTAGTALAGTAAPIDPGGRFRAGSVTKMFVATVVLQLVAEHRLRLDDPVERWLPGLLPAGADTPVRRLLDHTSGLYDVTDTLPLRPPAAFLPLRWTTWTAPELLARALAQPANFAPGEGYDYTSTGYLVLGMLIERLTGRPYAEEITRRVIAPLRLRGTTFPGTETGIDGPHAHAYIPDGAGGVIDITELNPSVMGAAGELISTAPDLNRFTAALLGGRLLPPAQLREMRDVVLPSERGAGLEARALPCGRIAYGHSGDAWGASAWTFATDGGRRVVTLSVTWGTGRPTNAAVTALLADAICRA